MSLSAVNPYAPPEADDDAVLTYSDDELESAGPGSRLAAALIDDVILFAPVILLMAAFNVFDRDKDEAVGLMVLCMLPVGLVQAVMLSMRGQTIGKRILGIKIVRMDMQPGGFWTYVIVRGWSVSVIGGFLNAIIPLKLGGLLVLADVLGVFTRDRRCLHDVFAKTRVVLVR
jgi:uncharacterized RDD family membrane protein YckC